MEHFFKGVDGVVETTPGYANGRIANPSYEEVYTDSTGHAETVRVRYRDDRVSLRLLTTLFFRTIDPLSLNRQGNDEGTRYRTGVYYTDEGDLPVLEEVFSGEEHRLGGRPVTELKRLDSFFEAEKYHKDYLDKNPGGYCHLGPKTFKYLRLYQDIKLFLGDETDLVARMADAAALIRSAMHFFWTGFYRVSGERLVLGPFQGDAACLAIGYGKGVCGKAWESGKTIVVPDVDAFPGHIACSSLSKSEIVVPLKDAEGGVTAVLDIDSDRYATFDGVDAAWLELIARAVSPVQAG